MEWKRDATDHLIREYKKHPVLYDMRHPRYYNKTTRGQALTRMVEEMQDVRPDTTMKEVLRKIQTMRTQFGQELAKARRHSLSGTSYQPTAWWFQGLSFLQHHIKHRSLDSTMLSDSDASWKQEPDDNSTFNLSIVRNGGSTSPTELSNVEFEHSTDGLEYETEVHYEINPIDMKSIKTVELKPVQSLAGGGKRDSRHLDRGERRILRSSQVTFDEQKEDDSSPSRQDQSSDPLTSSLDQKGLPYTGVVTVPGNTIDERQRSLGNFVAVQMSSIKDDYTYYETQMEVLNVINRGILRQLALDKGANKGEEENKSRDKRKNSG